MIRITTPLTKSVRAKLKAGDEALLTGTVYTARDAAHRRLTELLKKRACLPFDPKNAVIYYAGPTPERSDGLFGSCGPTTSSRMDRFTPELLRAGIGALIGKGRRSAFVRDSICRRGAVYFLTVGGAGAYLAKRITASRVVAFGELGPEAVYELRLEDFPLIVGIDSRGNDIYERA
jgi:fumarate hydratase subunit beta